MPKLGTKIVFGNGILVALCVVIGLVSYVQTRVVSSKIEEITELKEPINSTVYGLENNLVETSFAVVGYLSTSDPHLLDVFRDNQRQFEQIQQRYVEVAQAERDKEAGTRLNESYRRLQTIAEEQISLKDIQTRRMEALLNDLDTIDVLLTKRIRPSITSGDPVAYQRLRAALEMEVNANAIMKGVGNFLLTGQQRFEVRVYNAERDFRRYFQVYRNVLLSAEEKLWAEQLRSLSGRSLRLARTIIDAEKQKTQKLTEFVSLCRELRSVLNDRIHRRTENSLAEAKADVLWAGKKANATILLMLLFGVAFGIIAGSVTTKNVTSPLRHLASVMNAIAQGESTMKVDLQSSDELHSLGQSFNLMTGKLMKANEELRAEIVERERVQEQLRISEERFRTIFEDAPIGIALSDGEARFIQTNPAMQDMLSYTGAELSGLTLPEMLRPEDIHADQWLFSEVMEGRRRGYHLEVKCVRKDGHTVWSNLNVSRMQKEKVPCAIVMMEDITGRRATEQQMRMLAHTITSMNESVVITDLENRILSVNPAFLKTYGYTEQEIIGAEIDILRPQAASTLLPEAVLSALSAGGWSGELMNVRKNGEEFPILLSTSVVRDETGEAIALVGISRDITQQRRLQAQLEEAERRRSADLRRFAVSVQRAQEEERGRMSRELHDDLCQRLSGMKLRAEAFTDAARPVKKTVFRQLRDFTRELDRTITEVRRISSNLRPSVLNDFGLVSGLKLLCNEFEKFHNVRIIAHLDDSPPQRRDADVEIALYRVAQEALSNIAKHANASAVSLNLVYQRSSVQMIVADDGTGFDQQDATRAKGSGYGLGLISMRERSELLGGTFEVSSVREKGTTITVTIPLGIEGRHEENQNSDS